MMMQDGIQRGGHQVVKRKRPRGREVASSLAWQQPSCAPAASCLQDPVEDCRQASSDSQYQQRRKAQHNSEHLLSSWPLKLGLVQAQIHVQVVAEGIVHFDGCLGRKLHAAGLARMAGMVVVFESRARVSVGRGPLARIER